MPPEKEFTVNEYLTLKLESGKTNIYVKGRFFNQCKFLILNIPIKDLEYVEQIESIDEAADILGWKDAGQEGVKYEIDPNTEFWGHCSNLQAWVENDYNTEILHRTIAFPLLKQLTKVGDVKAKHKFKEEIAYRFINGNLTVKSYLQENFYLEYLTREEFFTLFSFSSELKEIEEELNSEFQFYNPSYGNEILYFLPTEWAQFEYRITDKCSKDAFVIGIMNYRLSKSKWSRIFNILSSIKQLELLDISDNKLKKLPQSITNLKNLKGLDLAYNKLKRVPESVYSLKNLKWLDLSYNKIKKFPIELNAREIEILNEQPASRKIVVKKKLKYYIRKPKSLVRKYKARRKKKYLNKKEKKIDLLNSNV